ncbi:ATP-binding cassette domain-containing protein [Mesoplasma melaleucae]
MNNENKTIALIGNNGSGKTTFAKILANLKKNMKA